MKYNISLMVMFSIVMFGGYTEASSQFYPPQSTENTISSSKPLTFTPPETSTTKTTDFAQVTPLPKEKNIPITSNAEDPSQTSYSISLVPYTKDQEQILQLKPESIPASALLTTPSQALRSFAGTEPTLASAPLPIPSLSSASSSSAASESFPPPTYMAHAAQIDSLHAEIQRQYTLAAQNIMLQLDKMRALSIERQMLLKSIYDKKLKIAILGKMIADNKEENYKVSHSIKKNQKDLQRLALLIADMYLTEHNLMQETEKLSDIATEDEGEESSEKVENENPIPSFLEIKQRVIILQTQLEKNKVLD